MSKQQFMAELKQLLGDIPGSERDEALDYYENFFLDAGEENEEQILRELESPEKVAHTIKAGLRDTDSKDGEFSETGFAGFYAREKEELVNIEQPHDEDRGFNHNTRRFEFRRNLPLVILIAICTSPLWLPLLGSIFGAVVGIFVAIFGITLGVFCAGLALLVAGIAIAVGSISIFTSSAMAGLLVSGIGLIIAGLGSLLTIFVKNAAAVIFPSIFKVCKLLISKVFGLFKRPSTV